MKSLSLFKVLCSLIKVKIFPKEAICVICTVQLRLHWSMVRLKQMHNCSFICIVFEQRVTFRAHLHINFC